MIGEKQQSIYQISTALATVGVDASTTWEADYGHRPFRILPFVKDEFIQQTQIKTIKLVFEVADCLTPSCQILTALSRAIYSPL
jgi:hypothetical protein